MNRIGMRGGLALAGLLGLALVGCGGSAPPPASSSNEPAVVKGRLTLKGKPLAGVEVHFNAANVNRRSAPTASSASKEDGSYEVTTLVGENAVSVGGAAVGKQAGRLAYFNKAVDLKAGENTVDLDIP